MDQGNADMEHDEAGGTGTGADSESTIELGRIKVMLASKIGNSAAHYDDLKPLGKGSFGEVHEARDTLLGRDVAIKSIKPSYRDEGQVVERFLKEARGTAQLEHPNIMPVHEMGVHAELGIYFTMKKIEGENLKEILDRLESGTSLYLGKYPLNHLLEIFIAVCNGVAFAHSRGVIHRDLKPANVMIGEFGEVLILDWGLVKKLGEAEEGSHGIRLDMEELDGGWRTMDGAVSGTPNYMAPEQAQGMIDEIGFHSDIYSLGAILYHILAHVPPFEKAPLRNLLENVKTGRFQPPRKRKPGLKIPRELEAVCLKAMSRNPLNRYRTVERLAADVRNYIGHHDVSAYKAPRHVRFWKGCRRNPVKASVAAAVLAALGIGYATQRAMAFGIYRNMLAQASEIRGEAEARVAEAKGAYEALERLRSQTTLRDKSEEELALEERLESLARLIDRRFTLAASYFERMPQEYRLARKVRDGFAEIMRQRIEFALHCGQYETARQWYETVIDYYKALRLDPSPESAAYLAGVRNRIIGDGRLRITCDGGIDEVVVWPLLEDGPRIVLGDAVERSRELPLDLPAIRKGSYLVMATRSDGGFQSYPVLVGHGEERTLDLQLPPSQPEGMVYVPGGPFICGGVESRFYRRHAAELPAFFIRQHEVTVAEYLEFWKGVDDPGNREAFMARIQYDQRDRRFHDLWDADGNLLDARIGETFPIVGITLDAARAFCDWKGLQLGATIRLPTADEWEKAARGVDGRTYPWGNGYDDTANLALTKHNQKGKEKYSLFAPPGSFKRDVSVFNAYDMGGNVREMTSTPLPGSESFFQLKGGSASTPATFLPCCYASDTPVAPSDVGFRYVMEIPR